MLSKDLHSDKQLCPWFRCCCSVAKSCPILWPCALSTPGFSVLHQFLELAQTHVRWVGEAIHPSHLLSPAYHARYLPQNQGFFFPSESALCIRWPKYWSFSFSISPSNKYSGLISFRIDWFNLLAVQGALKSLLRDHNSKALNPQHSAFFIVQLSYPYTTTGKITALTINIFVDKVMSLLFIHCLGLS